MAQSHEGVELIFPETIMPGGCRGLHHGTVVHWYYCSFNEKHCPLAPSFLDSFSKKSTGQVVSPHEGGNMGCHHVAFTYQILDQLGYHIPTQSIKCTAGMFLPIMNVEIFLRQRHLSLCSS